MVDTFEKHDAHEQPTNRWWFAVYTGFFAGLIWGAVRIAEYYFRMTDVVPGFLVEFFFRHEFLTTFWGGVIGWAVFIGFSVFAALLYAAFLHKAKGPWLGLIYGLFWWGVLYLMIGPSTGMIPWLFQIGWKTIITDVCLYSLWGLFIGFSIAVEFTDERDREKDDLLGGILR